ncbi:MAG TPA: transglutaminase family protein, partial [Ktedonobacteraceae bacterium]|nr:transglutaminase family protein [Ktedonobacteraceae bacterium]
MHLTYESPLLEDYLCEHEVVDYSHALIQEAKHHLSASRQTETECVRRTFEFVRDTIHHSLDIQSTRVTCNASEVLNYGEGLCYAKSHLLAALLRAQSIPTGFCYQRLAAGATPEMGYAL